MQANLIIPRGRPRRRLCVAAVALAAASAGASSALATAAPSLQDLGRLSIEQLADIDVSSVSKTEQPLSDAPAAVFVITHEDAVRSGATSLAEVLRLAPNLHVARVTANSYAISARGFNGAAADKLLVLIDGRSVYTPFSHGVFWDAVDFPAELIERVEVISGPGATLWGANAVNGVINVVTRRAGAEKGLRLQAGAGDRSSRLGAQFDGELGPDAAYQLYVSSVDYDHGETASGADARDGWEKLQGGFRLDWSPGEDLLTVQGDAYEGRLDQMDRPDQDISGRNLMARWTRPTGERGVLQVQAYYDFLERDVPGRIRYRLHTYDLDVQHSFAAGGRHKLVWGGGYRVTEDDFPIAPSPPNTQFFDPVGRTLRFANAFVQDTIALGPNVEATAGLKLEDDPYAGVEHLPSLRLAWKVSDRALLWGAVSRAVRAPSRLDRDFNQLQGSALVLTGRDFQPETLVAYELGYRGRPNPRTSLSVSTYYHVYDDLRSFELTDGGLPIVFSNALEGEAYGVEVWGSLQATDWWRLSGGGFWMQRDLRFKPGSSGIGGVSIAGNDPAYQAQLRSTMQLGDRASLDLALRRVDDLPNPPSPAYTELDASLRWAVSRRLEIVVTGSNLLDEDHLEFGSSSASLQLGAVGARTGRSVFVDTRWRF